MRKHLILAESAAFRHPPTMRRRRGGEEVEMPEFFSPWIGPRVRINRSGKREV